MRTQVMGLMVLGCLTISTWADDKDKSKQDQSRSGTSSSPRPDSGRVPRTSGSGSRVDTPAPRVPTPQPQPQPQQPTIHRLQGTTTATPQPSVTVPRWNAATVPALPGTGPKVSVDRGAAGVPLPAQPNQPSASSTDAETLDRLRRMRLEGSHLRPSGPTATVPGANNNGSALNLPATNGPTVGPSVGQPGSAETHRSVNELRERILRSNGGAASTGTPNDGGARQKLNVSNTPAALPPGIGTGMSRPIDRTPKRFPDRYREGQLAAVTQGATAQRLKFDEQFRMLQQGDVARRLNLNRPMSGVVQVNLAAPHYDRGRLLPPTQVFVGFHGPINPAYTRGCYASLYVGPSYFPMVTWYPYWNPWVDWCWKYRCHVWWDPRPVWCRPVVYVDCPPWGYYDPPVWTPLPAAVCGTWVDQRPVTVDTGTDLQLMAVRFVDPGHAEEKLGPRYRVWLRNNTPRAVVTPFSVIALAGLNDQLVAGLPQAGVRVTAVEAGDTQSVDVRLPVEALSMDRDPQGNPLPFRVLHVLVDANRELNDVHPENNGARIPRGEILPVDPAAFEVQPNRASPGAEVILAGEGFGPAPGRVVVNLNGQELDGEILGWCDLGVRLSLPAVALAAAAQAELVVVRGDGAAANPVPVSLVPAGLSWAPGVNTR